VIGFYYLAYLYVIFVVAMNLFNFLMLVTDCLTALVWPILPC